MAEDSKTRYTVEFTEEQDVIADSKEEAISRLTKAYGCSRSHFSFVDEEPTESIDGPAVEVKFHPREWDGDYIVDTKPRGVQTWTIPLEDATTDGRVVQSYSMESDALKEHERAPLWVRRWSGPFSIAVETVTGVSESQCKALFEGEPVKSVLE